jgi:hypothetical protein
LYNQASSMLSQQITLLSPATCDQIYSLQW